MTARGLNIARRPPPFGRLERGRSRRRHGSAPLSIGTGGLCRSSLAPILAASLCRRVIMPSARRPCFNPSSDHGEFRCSVSRQGISRTRLRVCSTNPRRRLFYLPLDPSCKTPSETAYRLPLSAFVSAPFRRAVHAQHNGNEAARWIRNVIVTKAK